MTGRPRHLEKIRTPTAETIEAAAHAIRGGLLVGMPTETVYGLAANALDAAAAARVFAAKRRPSFDPLIVHVLDREAATPLLDAPLRGAALALAEAFWPGPLTLVAGRAAVVPDLVCAGLHTIAVRAPAHSVARALIEASGVPLAAPSANPFGRASPTTAAHVAEELGDEVALILDGGPCAVGVESTIVSVAGDEPVILRFGGVPVERIEDVVGPVRARLHSTDRPEAPGQLTQHYAPETPVRVVGPSRPSGDLGRRALLVGCGAPPRFGSAYAHVVCLSAGGALPESARRVFAALREVDALRASGLDVMLCPDIGLGRAVNDRLRRAAATGGGPLEV